MSLETLNTLVAKWRREGLSEGVTALRALDYCLSDQQEPPEWVLETIVDCWNLYQYGPSEGFVKDLEGDIKQGSVPATLDEAFGIEARSKPATKKNATINWFGPIIESFIETNQLPICDESFRLAGESFGIEEFQARKWYYAYKEKHSQHS